jgi:hypothetical protein
MSDNNSAAASSFGDVWRVTITGKRKEGVTDEEFARRYALHGKLAGPLVAKHNGISYRLVRPVTTSFQKVIEYEPFKLTLLQQYSI